MEIEKQVLLYCRQLDREPKETILQTLQALDNEFDESELHQKKFPNHFRI
jgi:hypothetical protein